MRGLDSRRSCRREEYEGSFARSYVTWRSYPRLSAKTELSYESLRAIRFHCLLCIIGDTDTIPRYVFELSASKKSKPGVENSMYFQGVKTLVCSSVLQCTPLSTIHHHSSSSNIVFNMFSTSLISTRLAPIDNTRHHSSTLSTIHHHSSSSNTFSNMLSSSLIK